MNFKHKRRAIAAAAGLALAAGGGLAVAASSGPGDAQKAFLDDAAKRLDVTPDKLQSALRGAAGDGIDRALQQGRLTKEQADRLKQRLKDAPLPFGGPGFRGGHRHGGPGHFGPGARGGLDAAAKYLGLTPAELGTQLRSGKSLADVAKDKGKDTAGLKAAMTAAAKDRLDKAVAAGHLTKDQESAMLDRLGSKLDDVIAGKRPGRGDHRGMRGRWGPPPAARGGHSQGGSSLAAPGSSTATT